MNKMRQQLLTPQKEISIFQINLFKRSNEKMKKQKVFFVYRKSMANVGSTVMRVDQLMRIAQTYLHAKYDFAILPMPNKNIPLLQKAWVMRQPRGAVHFFSKKTTKSLTQSNAVRLQEKSAGICFDYVDTDMREIYKTGVDIHLSCSYSQKNILEELIQKDRAIDGKVMMLLHNADEKLYQLEQKPQTKLRVAYLGTRSVSVFNDEIESRMDVLDASTPIKMAESLHRLGNYNFHYAIRGPEPEGVLVRRPFTKGFTAAVMSANIIANRSVEDVMEFLGKDYPYLVGSTDEGEILEMLNNAKDSYGSKVWFDALDIMSNVADRISPKSIAGQIESILDELGVRKS